MSANDRLALETEYRNWLKARAIGLTSEIDPFEFFCAEQFVKDHLLSDEDIAAGIVDKSNDGGADAFYFLLGGRLVQEDTPMPQQGDMAVNLIFIQAKEQDGFSPLSVDRLRVLTDDVLDLQRTPDHYGRTYNKKLLHRMQIFKSKYQQLSLPRLVIDYYYITRADCCENDDCQRAADRVLAVARKHFSRAEVHPFHFIDGSKLYTRLTHRPRSEKKLHFVDWVDSPEGWIGLVKLKDFYAFLQGEDGQIVERIFDDNVRGFQMDTSINKSIYNTLNKSQEMPEFWLLNNGITVLSPDARSDSYRILKIVDPQIVNGLQTSRQIFAYFNNLQQLPLEDERRILVKVINNSDEDTRDKIIRATNNQNPMAAEALYTTFRIHKQIETVFKDKGFYYERRKGYYRDKRMPIAKIVSALSVVQAIVAIMIGKPDDARARPRDYINESAKRYSIFGHDDYDDSQPMMDPEVASKRPYDIGVYLQCVKLMRRVEEFLNAPSLNLDNEDKRNLKFYLARYLACATTKNAYCPPKEFLSVDVPGIQDEFMKNCLKPIRRIYQKYGGNDEAGKNPLMSRDLNKRLIREFSPPRREVVVEEVMATI